MSVLKTDNRLAAGLRGVKRLAGRSLYLPTEAPHFQVQVNGEWFVFCAIHKNASSSIRALVEAGSSRGRGADESIFRFLFLNHLVRSRKEVDRARHVMVFVRPPLDRVVSCFQNKFIQRKGNRTIFADFKQVTGADPAQATFERFVHDYLRLCFGGGKVNRHRDRHIYTQQQQLLPVDYDVVARVDQFDQVMNEVGLVQLLPGRTNSTSGAVEIPKAWSMSAEELHELYRETGQTPDKASLLNPALVEEINHHYRADIHAFGHLLGEEES